MNEDTGLKKILKWAGLVALIALPVVVILKKRKSSQAEISADDDSNIFSDELEV